MNCKIIVERHDSKSPHFNAPHGVVHTEYVFDDYRVAIAIENLLDNMNYVEVAARYYDPKGEKEQ